MLKRSLCSNTTQNLGVQVVPNILDVDLDVLEHCRSNEYNCVTGSQGCYIELISVVFATLLELFIKTYFE